MDGNDAEQLIARKYDLEPAEPNWCDLTNPRTGARYEVKKAERSREFRFWRDQHRSLQAAGNNVAAYYALVTDGGRTYKRVSPVVVRRVIERRDGWNESVHETRQARQKKVPVEEFKI
jgi:hypothetical protein